MSRRLANRDRFEHLNTENFSFSDQEAQANRRLLHWLMVEEGFAGHPDEWWHFSGGDQMWAAITAARLSGALFFFFSARPSGWRLTSEEI